MSVIVLILIILITLYLANQGMLSSLLALATSIFASILAMALVEPFHGVLAGWRPAYARGATFLVLFLVIYGALRFAADAAVPKNIKLSRMINRVAGGVVGFFTSLVVVGSMLIGLEMLPVSRAPLGFERFPGPRGMQAVEGDGKTKPGAVAPMHNVVLAPDRFVLALWKGAAHGQIGLPSGFASVHPDLSIESYGYRNQFPGSLSYLHGELLSVPTNGCAWFGAEKKLTTGDGVVLPAVGMRLLMVRTEIDKGSTEPKTSIDPGASEAYIRIAASQVRLVTDKGRQHYPVGYMEGGRTFVALPLDTGFLVDDFRGSKAIQDWIFEVAEDEAPELLEVKQLARVALSNPPKELVAAPLASSAYPPHGYFKGLCSLNVTFDPKAGTNLKAGHVYVLKTGATCGDLSTSTLRNAHDHVLAWSGQAKPGVPQPSIFSNAVRDGRNLLLAKPEDPISYTQLIPLLLLGEAQNDGDQNLQRLPVVFDTTVMDILNRKATRKGSLIIGQADSDASGRADVQKIQPGKHSVIITLLTDKGFYVWLKDDMDFPEMDGRGQPRLDSNKNPLPVAFTASPGGNSGNIGLNFHIDLDEKGP